MVKHVTPVPGEEVIIFTSPHIDATRLGYIYPGEIIIVLQESFGWSQIIHKDIQGWAATHMLQEFISGPISQDLFYLSWPTDYKVITQGFNLNPQWYNKYGLPGHEGLDIQAPMNSNIYACADGIVESAYEGGNYGRQVRIDHRNGFKTIYAHLNTIAVTAGQEVKRKQIIGQADSTGNSTGSHLHLTLKRLNATINGETVFPNDIINPTPYLVRD